MILVCDVLKSPGWSEDFITDDIQELMRMAEKNPGCAVFVDESAESIGRYDDGLIILTTRYRHKGINTTLITQRLQSLNKTLREQCEYYFFFSMSLGDAKAAASLFHKDLIAIADLPKGHYLFWKRFAEDGKPFVPKRGKVSWAK